VPSPALMSSSFSRPRRRRGSALCDRTGSGAWEARKVLLALVRRGRAAVPIASDDVAAGPNSNSAAGAKAAASCCRSKAAGGPAGATSIWRCRSANPKLLRSARSARRTGEDGEALMGEAGCLAGATSTWRRCRSACPKLLRIFHSGWRPGEDGGRQSCVGEEGQRLGDGRSI